MKNIKENELVELVFILDKSGSMSGMEEDTIGGFNSMIEKQRTIDGKVLISTVLFSNKSYLLHDRMDLIEVEPLTLDDYIVGGSTALLDAIGGAIEHIKTIHKYARKEDVPSRTMFIITTDGMENASRSYNHGQIKEMIKTQEKIGWEFLFVADNIDVEKTAESIGIKIERTCKYNVLKDTKSMYCGISETIKEYRKTGLVSDSWSEKIRK